jgi:hypothetical protein
MCTDEEELGDGECSNEEEFRDGECNDEEEFGILLKKLFLNVAHAKDMQSARSF